MIRIDDGTRRFTYRVAGVAINAGMVLVHRGEHEPFWTLPGGRAEHGERAEDTLKREMQEELDTPAQVGRLLWVAENFFEHDGFSNHELGFYFMMRFPGGSRPMSSQAFQGMDGSVRLEFRWVPINPRELSRLPILPAFLATGLSSPPATVEHVVHRETKPSSSSPRPQTR